MFYSHSFLSKHGPLGTIWIAAYCFKKLKKSHVKDTDISFSVDKILQDEFDVVTYRTLAHLLLGIVRIYSKKVEYLHDDCNKVLLKIKDYMVKFKDTTIIETLKAPYFSITLPERFELDAFDLEILEDATRCNVLPPEEITLKEGIWKSGKTGQSSVDKYKGYAACHDNIPGEDFLSSQYVDFEMELGTMCGKSVGKLRDNLFSTQACQDAEMSYVVEEEPPNPVSLSSDNHQVGREHINISETISLNKVDVKASRQELFGSSLYQANVSSKTIGEIEEHNRLEGHDMGIQDAEFHGEAVEHFDLSDVDAILEKLRCGSFSQEMQTDTKLFCSAEQTSANVRPLGEEQESNEKHNNICEINLSENVENAVVANDHSPQNIIDATPQSMCRDAEEFCLLEETSANVGPLSEEQQNNAKHNKLLEMNLSENVKSAAIVEDPPQSMFDATPQSKFRVEDSSANVEPLGDEQHSAAHNKISEMNQLENVKSVVVTKDKPPSKILDATPQSKFRGNGTPEISVIHTPVTNEYSQMKRKRNCTWDDEIAFPNDFMKKCIHDSSSLVSKRRKVPCNALAAWRTHQVSDLRNCFLKPLIACASLELSSLFSWNKAKIPVSVETAEVSQVIFSDSPANDKSGEIVKTLEKKTISQPGSAGVAVGNTEPLENLTVEASQDILPNAPAVNDRLAGLVEISDMTAILQPGSAGHAVANKGSPENLDVSELRPVDRLVEPGEPSAELGVPASPIATGSLYQKPIAPETPTRQTTALRPFDSPERAETFNLDGIGLVNETVNKGLASPCNDQEFNFSLINKEMNLSEGDNYEDHYGLSERTRLVAQFLLTCFLNQRKQGEGEIVNLSWLLEGRTKKESARIFYELLVLKSKGYVHVKQENAYADILVSKSLQWDQVFGTNGSSLPLIDPPPVFLVPGLAKMMKLLQAFWNSPIGPKTTHFWGPALQWGIPFAAFVDSKNPPESISGNMTGVMCVYSALFMRYAWMVRPQNLQLLACHATNETVQLYQLSRWLNYQRSLASQDNEEAKTM